MSKAQADSNFARMLVIEDDPRSRKVLEAYLRAEGYHVRSAPDGESGLELARRQVPDVVFLDVMMPGMTGHQVCRVLKQEPNTRLSQVMLVTALAGTPDKVQGLDIGADDYVTKPVRRDEFLAKVRALLRVRRVLVELETARAALSARNDELELKKTLAQSLVHDLKSPLQAMLGNLELLEMQCDQSLHYLIDRSRQGMNRMQSMILNLLDVERLEEGRLVPSLDAVDLGKLARSCIDDASPGAVLGEVAIVLNTPGEASQKTAKSDATLMRRVIDNLIANAITHTPAGRKVEVFVRARPEGVEISVCDSGPGVPLEHRESVFEKYAQLGARAAGVTSNRGLGLTFCQLAIEAQGGTIWVDDAEAGGAAFRMILPDAQAAGSEQPESALASAG